MLIESKKIHAVPTNIITGFLGSGKTSAIINLVKQKPKHERWAILVNEFGEIGIDSALISGHFDAEKSIFIKEVPGGCMCCSSSLTMQIALNQLLTESKPDRLLIEPTGLGHPLEVLQLLSSQHYKDVLNLEKTVALVDARQLDDCRFTEHDTFNQQLAVADIIVGNKLDLYSDIDSYSLTHYTRDHHFFNDKLYFVNHAEIKLDWLTGKSNYKEKCKYRVFSSSPQKAKTSPIMPLTGFVKATNQGEGYESIGWRFPNNIIFDKNKLMSFLKNIDATRIKAAFNTTQGSYGYNIVGDGINEKNLKHCTESRIEIICDKIDDSWEAALKNTIHQ